MLQHAVVLLLTLAGTSATVDVELTKRSTIYFPYEYSGDVGQFDMFKDAVEQFAYDSSRKILYASGLSILHAINVSNPDNMTFLSHVVYSQPEFSDIDYCGGYIFATVNNIASPADGHLVIFKDYNATTGTMEEVKIIPVGASPDEVRVTSDCSKIVVAVAGQPYEQPANQMTDPPGLVVIVSFPKGMENDHDMVSLNFTAFDSKVEEMRPSGVRHVYQDNGTPFSNDAEPEYVEISSDNTRAFVSLQANNALVEVNLTTQTITDIHGLGFKDWSKYQLDPSDEDNGVFLRNYSIKGMYQPDAIRYFRFQGVDYIMLSDEGYDREYEFGTFEWIEEIRGAAINQSQLNGFSDDVKAQLANESLLGRLKFSSSPSGRDPQGQYRDLYAFGARGWTVRWAHNMSIMYESGGDVEKRTKDLKYDIFNCLVENVSGTPKSAFDKRSDDKGPEPEAVDAGVVNGVLLYFVGNERTGTILVYSQTDSTSGPQFQDIYSGIADAETKSWRQQFDERTLSEIDLEQLTFVPAAESPTGGPILFAVGAASSSLSIIDVTVTDTSTPIPNVDDGAESLGGQAGWTAFVLATVVFLLHIR